MSSSNFFLYILTNKTNTVLYIGMTNNLERRIYEHKNKINIGFTQKYNVDKLVYFESTTNAFSAIEREKEIKKWRREKKNDLINAFNPEWKDLSEEWNLI
ncbi:MAG: GIY-YIG nuclease family protein [Leptospiraceae bacterium]|nr:GIY-YIG nuclease family protein [Leptospiraceae bacterium]